MFKTISSSDWQLTLLGTTPTEDQLRLYTLWPNSRGFSNTDQDRGKFAATLILSLRSGYAKDKIVMLVPRSLESWALQQIKEHATYAITSCKKWPDQVKFLSEGYLRLFSKVNLLSHTSVSEPQYWTSFGYSKEDPTIPTWLKTRLI